MRQHRLGRDAGVPSQQQHLAREVVSESEDDAGFAPIVQNRTLATFLAQFKWQGERIRWFHAATYDLYEFEHRGHSVWRRAALSVQCTACVEVCLSRLI